MSETQGSTEENKPAEEVKGQEPGKTDEQGGKPDESEQASSEESAKEQAAEQGKEASKEEESKLTHDDALKALGKTRKEAGDWRTKFRDLEKTLADAKTPEQVEEIVATMKTERETAERTLTVENVALKFKLPEDLADALRGDTREELEAHATKLAKYVPEDETDPEDLSGGLKPGSSDTGFDAVAEARAARNRRY